MKMYFLICAIMLLVFMLRIWAELIEYRRKHPEVLLGKGSSFPKSLFTLLQIYFYFCIPVLNVILFVYFVFLADDKIYIDAIEKRVVK